MPKLWLYTALDLIDVRPTDGAKLETVVYITQILYKRKRSPTTKKQLGLEQQSQEQMSSAQKSTHFGRDTTIEGMQSVVIFLYLIYFF